MKASIVIAVAILAINPIFSQETLSTTNASWSHSGKCVTRSIENFILMLEMPSSSFESQMKKVGAKVTLGQDYCIQASEQLGTGASFTSPAFIFNKCDNNLHVDWYGSKTSTSVFKSIMDDIKDHYIDTRDGMRYYGLKYNNIDYVFRFRRVQKGDTIFEFLLLLRGTVN